jgi:hypothetical protein
MLFLDIPTQPFWVDCPHGVRLLVRPCTTALNHAALARAARRLREMQAAGTAPVDEDLRAGLTAAEAMAALGEVLIADWEGVGNADGTEAAPVTPENVRALLSMPEIERAFNIAISSPLARLAAEGNA